MRNPLILLGGFCFHPVFAPATVSADIIEVVNAGFEDTSGQNVVNEFTFGTPNGWTLHDPESILGANFYTGTLEPNGNNFFDSTAPEGIKVALLFNSRRQGQGEYGYRQDFQETLQANTRYRLSVEVGNIGSDYAESGVFYDLSGFPGYRVDLLAGDTVIAQDHNSLDIPERQWDTSVIDFTTGQTHELLGASLAIRLVNLNQIPDGYNQFNSPDLEVYFDDVRFETSAVPEPGTLASSSLLLVLLGWRVRKRRKTNHSRRNSCNQA
ncbi:MAG: PEP-CTERM sorting domain-containing protein [Planctomycetota bacterium]|nr:PEP-CTERM sorting domain-containing protein [Planctomycetota bacterium]